MIANINSGDLGRLRSDTAYTLEFQINISVYPAYILEIHIKDTRAYTLEFSQQYTTVYDQCLLN